MRGCMVQGGREEEPGMEERMGERVEEFARRKHWQRNPEELKVLVMVMPGSEQTRFFPPRR